MNLARILKNFTFVTVMGVVNLFPSLQRATSDHQPPDFIPQGKTPEVNFVLASRIGPELTHPVSLKAEPVPELQSERARILSKELERLSHLHLKSVKGKPVLVGKKKPNEYKSFCALHVRLANAKAGMFYRGSDANKLDRSLLERGYYKIGANVPHRAGDAAIVNLRNGHVSTYTTNNVWVSDVDQGKKENPYNQKAKPGQITYYRSSFYDPPVNPKGLYSWSYGSSSYLLQEHKSQQATFHKPVVAGYYKHTTKERQVAALASSEQPEDSTITLSQTSTKREFLTAARQATGAQDIFHERSGSKKTEILHIVKFVENNLDVIAKRDLGLEQDAVHFIIRNTPKGRQRAMAISRLSCRLTGPRVC